MKPKTKPLHEFEIAQYAVYMALQQMQKEIETGVEGFISKYLRICGALAVAIILAFWMGGAIHPIRWGLVGLKWTAIAYCTLILLWTCRVKFFINRDRRRGISEVRRLKALLRRCLFKGKCLNRRTKLHLARNYFVWYGLGMFGNPGLAVWLYVIKARAFVCCYFFLFTGLFRLRKLD